jgi:tetratricopeptide (TPR) repeat protein
MNSSLLTSKVKLGINRTFVPALLAFTVCAVLAALAVHSRTDASPQRRSRVRSRLRATPTPRRPLPKPVTTARGFNQFSSRDASSRLVVGAATRGGDSAGTSYQNGETAYAAGKFAEAVTAFSEAVRLKPSWAEAHYALALSLNEVKELKQAIDEFNEVVKLKGVYELVVLSHYNIGNNYFDLKKYAEAIEAYRQSIDLDPDRSESRNNLALAYAALNRLPEAIAELEQAVKLNPEYAAARYNLGVAYLQSGKKSEAGEQQRALMKLDAELARRLENLIKENVRPR